MKINEGQIYDYRDPNTPMNTSPEMLKFNPSNIFMRRISYGGFRNLADKSKIRSFEINRSKLLLIYNSQILGPEGTHKTLSEFGKLGRLVEKMSSKKDFESENLINKKSFYGLYDTYFNSRNGLKIFHHLDKLPCLRIYREEDGKKGFYKERCGMISFNKMINFLVDHSFEDFMINSYDV